MDPDEYNFATWMMTQKSGETKSPRFSAFSVFNLNTLCVPERADVLSLYSLVNDVNFDSQQER